MPSEKESMNILLLDPGTPDLIAGFGFYPRLGLRILAELTPPEHHVHIAEDRDAKDIDFTDQWDLVGITALTLYAHRAYAVADRFRALGVPVVLGGIHAFGNPEEARQHADAVCIGEGERVWPQILRDVQKDQLQPFYQADQPLERATLPSPRRLPTDRQKHFGFPVECGRGCSIPCDYCYAPVLFGKRFQPREVERVVADIESVLELTGHDPRTMIIFSENLLPYQAPARQLFNALEGLSIAFSVEGRFEGLDDDYLDLAFRAGCRNIYVQPKLVSPRQHPDVVGTYAAAMGRILSRRINVTLSMIFGEDNHEPAIFDELWEFLAQNNFLRFASPLLLTPWPGTPLYRRLEQEDRIIHRNWSQWNNNHVVFRPRHMSPEELQDRYEAFRQKLAAWKKEHVTAPGPPA